MQRSLFLPFFLLSFCSSAQLSTSFFIDGVLDKKSDLKDSLALTDQIREYKLEAISKGFYFVGVDSLTASENELNVYLHLGEKKKFDLGEFEGRNLKTSVIKRIKYLSDNGYPFASIQIDSIGVDGDKLIGKVVEEKGPFITNDSSFFYSETKTSQKYIHHLLDHVIGEPFNESSYKRINRRIDRSPFLTFRRPVDISFQNKRAKLYLDIEESDDSSFEGVLGLQQQGAEKSTLVGSLDLNIQNLFRSGKELQVKWESFASESQELSLAYSHPFFMQTKLTPYFKFDLLKQDSIFLKRSARIDIGTFVSSDIEVRLGYNRGIGSLLTTEESTLQGENIADYTSGIYSIKLNRGRQDNVHVLKSDYSWDVTVSLGTKRIENNLSLPDSFYDTLVLKTDIFHFDFKGLLNQRVFERQQFSQRLEIGIIQNDELLNNERYRLGGLKSIRGFNEKFFFADQYVLSRTELRSFFEKGSYIYAFYDQLFFRNAEFEDRPLGTGIGFLLSTLSGQFNFALAIGKSSGQSMDFSNMKAHFGYITKF